MKVLFLFGPNLGALGRRDPELYGAATLDDVMADVVAEGAALGHEIAWRQSDHEGALVGWLLGGGGRRHRGRRDEPRCPVALFVRAA